MYKVENKNFYIRDKLFYSGFDVDNFMVVVKGSTFWLIEFRFN